MNVDPKKPKRVIYKPVLALLISALAVLGVLEMSIRRSSGELAAERAFTELQYGCGRGDQPSCGALLLRVEKPCVDDRDPRACLWLGFLNERRFGPGYERGDVLAAGHFGVACAGGIQVACTILRDHYEAPSAPCPFADNLNPFGNGNPMGCFDWQKKAEKPLGMSQDPENH